MHTWTKRIAAENTINDDYDEYMSKYECDDCDAIKEERLYIPTKNYGNNRRGKKTSEI